MAYLPNIFDHLWLRSLPLDCLLMSVPFGILLVGFEWLKNDADLETTLVVIVNFEDSNKRVEVAK